MTPRMEYQQPHFGRRVDGPAICPFCATGHKPVIRAGIPQHREPFQSEKWTVCVHGCVSHETVGDENG